MSNYPPGAENDPSAPYNQIGPKVDISINNNCIDVDNGSNNLSIDEYDIVNNLIPDEFINDEIKEMSLHRGHVELKMKSNNSIYINNDEIISYFYTKIG
jgi:hypothetical protein